MGIITHIVSFKYKSTASTTERALFASSFLALKDTCLAPTSTTSSLGDNKAPYILSLTGGTNNSPEGHSKGFDHTFIVTFASLADRDYYLTDDPIHNKFKALVGPAIEEAFVYDFDAGVF